METGAVILGVDGGGTNTRARLARVEERVGQITLITLGEGHTAGSNPLSLGLTAAVANICSASKAACRSAGIEPSEIAASVFGIAGGGSPNVAAQLAAQLQAAGLGRKINVLSDVEALLAACTGKPTMVVISGTGSACYAQAADGPTISAGGWGYLIDDDGSGFWLGQQMLRSCIAAREFGKVSPFEPAVLNHLNVPDLAALKSAIYGDIPRARERIASLSRPLCELARSGEEAAHALLSSAAKLLAERAIRAGKQANLPTASFKLQLTGGVLLACEQLQNEVVEEIKKEFPLARIVLAPDALEACLWAASRLVRE